MERIDRLNEFWGNKKLAQINSRTCAAFVKHRGRTGGAKRPCDFSSRHQPSCKRGTSSRTGSRIASAEKAACSRWLTRGEAAALVWQCWRYREQQTVHSGNSGLSRADGTTAVEAHCPVHFDRSVYGHKGGRDRLCFALRGRCCRSTSISSAVFFTAKRSADDRPRNAKRQYRCRPDCLHTCGAGRSAS